MYLNTRVLIKINSIQLDKSEFFDVISSSDKLSDIILIKQIIQHVPMLTLWLLLVELLRSLRRMRWFDVLPRILVLPTRRTQKSLTKGCLLHVLRSNRIRRKLHLFWYGLPRPTMDPKLLQVHCKEMISTSSQFHFIFVFSNILFKF